MWRVVPLMFGLLLIVVAAQGGCSLVDYAAEAQHICGAGKVRSVTTPNSASNQGVVVCTNGSVYGIER